MFSLAWRSLLYYWRTNLAVAAGVAIATAVLTGALVIGDSVRGSLRQLTLKRLGPVDFVLTGSRFFEEPLAEQLRQQSGTGIGEFSLAPAIVMTGSVETSQAGQTRRAGQTLIYAVDERAWSLIDPNGKPAPVQRQLFVNSRLAQTLQLQPGQAATLWVELPSAIPRETLLGKRDQDAQEIALEVHSILEPERTASRLAFDPNQQTPQIAYVSLQTLQSALSLEAIRPTRRDPTNRPPRVNTLLLAAPTAAADVVQSQAAVSQLSDALRRSWTLGDLGLRLVPSPDRRSLAVESEMMILDDRIAETAQRIARVHGASSTPVLVYLANSLTNPRAVRPENAKQSPRPGYSMYSTVAGLASAKLAAPFGPLPLEPDPATAPALFTGNGQLEPDEIILNRFLADDLQAEIGSTIELAYHEVGAHGELPERTRSFRVAGIVAMEGAAVDRGWSPEVKGITDAESLSEWDQPFPMKTDVITDRDEDYWDQYKATPKAYLSLARAQELWRSRYGALTSVRIAPAVPAVAATNGSAGESPSSDEAPAISAGTPELATLREAMTRGLLAELTPAQVGLIFRAVKQEGLAAASGSTDFAGLFLGFSSLLIVSAMILIVLLFRLGIEQRIQNLGVLAAVGLSAGQIRRLILAETAIVVLTGIAVGLIAAIAYSQTMLYGLRTWWNSAIGTQELFLHVVPATLVTGGVVAGIVACLSAWWGLKELNRSSVREQLQGVLPEQQTAAAGSGRTLWLASLAIGGALALLVCLVAGVVPASEAAPGLSWPVLLFFQVGFLLLGGCLGLLAAWLKQPTTALSGRGNDALRRLGFRNAGRHRSRSLMTTGLIAFATFMIVAVAAGQRNPIRETPDRLSGNGGFTLVAESSSPLLADLGTIEGRNQLQLGVQRPADRELLEGLQAFAFRVKPGDDASCLNLFQVARPTILGVPQRFIERGGFRFVAPGRPDPWQLLNGGPAATPASAAGSGGDTTSGSSGNGSTNGNGNSGAIPVLGDMNTLMFSLKKAVGDTLMVSTPAHESAVASLQIVGQLDNSVFQGVLLMSEENFLRLFPEQTGYRYFLLETAVDRASAVSDVLETGLASYGFDAEPVATRLARFLAVQNTYLSTFQALGGLGLLLGTIGLATVMLRNVLERRKELALLRAIGYSGRAVSLVVLAENTLLLVIGLAVGTVSALIAMTPHLTSTGADVPWLSGGLLLGMVFVAGLIAALGAMSAATRTPILAGLRSE